MEENKSFINQELTAKVEKIANQESVNEWLELTQKIGNRFQQFQLIIERNDPADIKEIVDLSNEIYELTQKIVNLYSLNKHPEAN